MTSPNNYPVADPEADLQLARDAAEALVAEQPDVVAFVLADEAGGMPVTGLDNPRTRELVTAILGGVEGDLERARNLLREYA